MRTSELSAKIAELSAECSFQVALRLTPLLVCALCCYCGWMLRAALS